MKAKDTTAILVLLLVAAALVVMARLRAIDREHEKLHRQLQQQRDEMDVRIRFAMQVANVPPYAGSGWYWVEEYTVSFQGMPLAHQGRPREIRTAESWAALALGQLRNNGSADTAATSDGVRYDTAEACRLAHERGGI